MIRSSNLLTGEKVDWKVVLFFAALFYFTLWFFTFDAENVQKFRQIETNYYEHDYNYDSSPSTIEIY